MTKIIKEAFKLVETEIECSICHQLTFYHDVLEDETICCPVCSYKYRFTQDLLCKQHLDNFDPTDQKLMQVMVKISEQEKMKHALDPDSVFEVVLSPEIRDKLSEVALEQKTGLNEIVIAGLSWFVSLISRKKVDTTE